MYFMQQYLARFTMQGQEVFKTLAKARVVIYNNSSSVIHKLIQSLPSENYPKCVRRLHRQVNS